jgi:hypothetical protein
MPPPTMGIRIIEDVSRFKPHDKLAHEAIARSLLIAKGVVAKYVALATASVQDRGVVAALGEAEVE